tara:strand:- start:6 stop:341 length:336 start_codon:yes stop_codon:yes gene_type:complete
MQSLLANKSGKIIPVNEIYNKLNENKISKPIMTKYEFNQIIAQRATMLAHGATSFLSDKIEIKSNLELREIAKKELLEGKLPFIIKRYMPDNKYELYRVKDLDLVSVQHMF